MYISERQISASTGQGGTTFNSCFNLFLALFRSWRPGSRTQDETNNFKSLDSPSSSYTNSEENHDNGGFKIIVKLMWIR